MSVQRIMNGYLGALGVGFEFTSLDLGPGFEGRMQRDSVLFTQVPEPSSASLLLAGLAGAFAARRRR